jgi:hypothetical protein
MKWTKASSILVIAATCLFSLVAAASTIYALSNGGQELNPLYRITGLWFLVLTDLPLFILAAVFTRFKPIFSLVWIPGLFGHSWDAFSDLNQMHVIQASWVPVDFWPMSILSGLPLIAMVFLFFGASIKGGFQDNGFIERFFLK